MRCLYCSLYILLDISNYILHICIYCQVWLSIRDLPLPFLSTTEVEQWRSQAGFSKRNSSDDSLESLKSVVFGNFHALWGDCFLSCLMMMMMMMMIFDWYIWCTKRFPKPCWLFRPKAFCRFGLHGSGGKSWGVQLKVLVGFFGIRGFSCRYTNPKSKILKTIFKNPPNKQHFWIVSTYHNMWWVF